LPGCLGVVLEGGFDAHVAHALLDNFGVDSSFDEHRGVGASQVVEREVGQPGFLSDFLQDPLGDISIVEGFAVR